MGSRFKLIWDSEHWEFSSLNASHPPPLFLGRTLDVVVSEGDILLAGNGKQTYIRDTEICMSKLKTFCFRPLLSKGEEAAGQGKDLIQRPRIE